MAKSVAAATLAFVASATAVLAAAALVFPNPLRASDMASGTGSRPQRPAAVERSRLDYEGDSPVALSEVKFAPDGQSVIPSALGSLQIPAIELDTQIYAGVHDEIVELGPGLWPGTPIPGSPGNAVLAGHRTSHTHPFEDLDLLKPGDLIRAIPASGATADFQVLSVEVVPESEYVEYVLAEPASPETVSITLFACAPKGSRTHRIVARATALLPHRGPVSEGGDA